MALLLAACGDSEAPPGTSADGASGEGGGGVVSGSGGVTGGNDSNMDASNGSGGGAVGSGGASPAFDAGPVPASAYVYVARGSSEITILSLDMASGELSPKGTTLAGDQSVGYLAFSPDKRFLYAVSEADGINSKVYASKVNAADGSLTAINSAITGGDGAPHVAVHPSGKLIMIAHYGSGDVSSLKVDDAGGVSMPLADVKRPFDRTSHQVVFDASGKFAFVPNIDANTIFQYGVDAMTGKLTANGQVSGLPDMAGPRHMAFHPSGKYAFVMNEVATTVTSLAYDSSTGNLSSPVTIDSLPAGAVRDMDTSGAHILAHPSGKFVFSSNRGHNSISTFAVDANGRLTLTSNETAGGMMNMPRDFGMDPSGRYLVVGNQDASNVMVFEISPTDGKLTLRDTKPVPGSPSFVGVIFL
jgi:6-phosphogluconolactonase